MNAVTPDELATQVLEDSGYFEMLKMDKSVEAPGRIENLKELISVMGDTEKYPTLADFWNTSAWLWTTTTRLTPTR